MVDTAELCKLIADHAEWLLVREMGRTFALGSGEIEVEGNGKKAHFGFLDDDGFHSWRLNKFEVDGGEVIIDVAGAFGKKQETMRLVPRTAAAELTAQVELARLEKANEIAKCLSDSLVGVKLGRVALNADNGRLAQILFEIDKRPMAAIADITGTLTVEPIFTAAMLWIERKLSLRKKAINEILIICEKRQAKNAQKLHALLNDRWKAKITIYEINRKADPIVLVELPKRKIRELWRERAQKLKLPERPQPSETANRILDLSPENTDIILSKQGETLRFAGLPFARVRAVMGIEKAWFGIGRERRMLTGETWDEMERLASELAQDRGPNALNKRHQYYRSAPEAWLESILRRNIKLLDANLILSPIYNQFRSSNDKIDLLALRRDGRLVIIELKTQPDREMIFQAVDYWRKIELQRRRGVLAAADLFDGRQILDKPALIYLAAPAWSFHREFEFFARTISPGIELWRFELHEHWREKVKVLARKSYASEPGGTNL
jgi:hypothetical protein